MAETVADPAPYIFHRDRKSSIRYIFKSVLDEVEGSILQLALTPKHVTAYY
jgi:hypothetical protein